MNIEDVLTNLSKLGLPIESGTASVVQHHWNTIQRLVTSTIRDTDLSEEWIQLHYAYVTLKLLLNGGHINKPNCKAELLEIQTTLEWQISQRGQNVKDAS